MQVLNDRLVTENMVVEFHRTVKLPEDGKTYPLPASCGLFPVKRVADYKDTVPKEWLEHGGVFLPMYQREAMWLAFRKRAHQPCAIKIGVGKVNAITGEAWKDGLDGDAQDYLVAPPQKWLDGINAGDDVIKQFVAMPLGMGYSVEGQVTGEEKHGGLQLAIYPGKREHFPKPKRHKRKRKKTRYRSAGAVPTSKGASGQSLGFGWSADDGLDYAPHETHSTYCDDGGDPLYCCAVSASPAGGNQLVDTRERGVDASPTVIRRSAKRVTAKAAQMGLSAGGSMRQKVYPDLYGVEVWDQDCKQRVFVHLVNSTMYREITGEAPPASPVTKGIYARMGYPWFDVWDHELEDVEASDKLAGVKTVAEKDKEHGFEGQQDDTNMPIETVHNCGTPEVVPNKGALDGSW